MIVVAGAMMGWSADLILDGQLGILPALFAFAAVGFIFAVSDFIRLARRGHDPLARVTRHMIRALGALIGALTAFAIQNGEAFPPIVPSYVYWCIPAALFVPVGLIYRFRIARGRLRVPGLALTPSGDERVEPDVAAPRAGDERRREEAPPAAIRPEPAIAPEPPSSEPVRYDVPAESDVAPGEPVSETQWSEPPPAEFPLEPARSESEPPRDEVPSAHYWSEPGR
jgi:hypothetical protein